MDVRELHSPDDYTPTPSIRYRVMTVTPEPDGTHWTVGSREVGWDAQGNEVPKTIRDQVLTTEWLERTKLIWRSQRFVPVARAQSGAVEITFYESQEDRQRLEAQTSRTLPDSLEVLICAERNRGFKCQVPPTFAFSVRSAAELARQDIGHTELQISERRGTLTAKVYWLNGQPSAEAEARWQPIIERKVREYLQNRLTQSLSSFMNGGLIEQSVRLGDDVRDLIMAGVDQAALLAKLKAKDYQPIDDGSA